MSVMETFRVQAGRVQDTVDSITAEEWRKPGLGVWTVAELVAHLIRAADRIGAYLDLPVTDSEPVCDRVSYFDFVQFQTSKEDLSQAVAQRSRDDAQRYGTSALPATFAAAWRATLDVTEGMDESRLIQTIRGPMRLDAYAATRVFELSVHHIDLCLALDRPDSVDPGAMGLTTAILDGLVKGDRPPGLADRDWVLAATGRTPHADPRLPVIS